jgi:hypothetical protein
MGFFDILDQALGVKTDDEYRADDNNRDFDRTIENRTGISRDDNEGVCDTIRRYIQGDDL